MTGPRRRQAEPTPMWMRYAACKGVDTNIFFPIPAHQGPGGMPPAVFAPAKQICAECPAINACRDHAIAHPGTYGVWGGLTENERQTIRRREARARARRRAS